MNIFTAFNDGYVLPTKVMLKSLILNDPEPHTIYVFYSSLQQSSIDSIRELEDPEKATFFFQQVEDHFLDGIVIPPTFSRETYYRLFACRLFPEEVERVLWLDGDMIINGPLGEFYHQDLQGKIFVAIRDCLGDTRPDDLTEKRAALNMKPDAVYVNSGVMLFDLKAMRERIDEEEVLRYIKVNQDILLFPDQDVFNGLLHEHFLIADPERRYNFFARVITMENRKSILSNARVIHYCGGDKPWKKGMYAPSFSLWWKYADTLGPEDKKLYPETQALMRIKIGFHDGYEALKSFFRERIPGPYRLLQRIYYRIVGE